MLITWIICLFLHPIYISVTEVSYSASNQAVQCAHKIFLDDLELALEAEFKTNIKTDDPQNLNTYLEKYLRKHTGVRVNGQDLQASAYLGSEIQGDVIWAYMEYGSVKKIKRIAVRNESLFGSFPSQKNIIHLNVLGTKQTTYLTKPGEWFEVDLAKK